MRTVAEIGAVCGHVAAQLESEPATEDDVANAALLLMVAAHDLEPMVKDSFGRGTAREARLARAALKDLRDRIYRVRDHVHLLPTVNLQREMQAALYDTHEILFLLMRATWRATERMR